MRCMPSADDEKRWCDLSGEPATRSQVRAVVVASSSDWAFAFMKLLLPESVDVVCWAFS